MNKIFHLCNLWSSTLYSQQRPDFAHCGPLTVLTRSQFTEMRAMCPTHPYLELNPTLNSGLNSGFFFVLVETGHFFIAV